MRWVPIVQLHLLFECNLTFNIRIFLPTFCLLQDSTSDHGYHSWTSALVWKDFASHTTSITKGQSSRCLVSCRFLSSGLLATTTSDHLHTVKAIYTANNMVMEKNTTVSLPHIHILALNVDYVKQIITFLQVLLCSFKLYGATRTWCMFSGHSTKSEILFWD